MINSEGVIEDSPTSDLGQSLDVEDRMAALVDELQAPEDSSTSAAPSEQGETEPDADKSSEVEAKAEKGEDAEATKEKEPEDSISKGAFLKRVNGLNAQKRRAETQLIDSQKENAEYREAFQILAERVQAAESKLSEYEEVDPRDQQLRDMQYEKKAADIRTKLEAEHQQRIQEMQRVSEVENRADAIVDEAQHWAENYKTLTAEEIVYRYRTSDLSMKDLAKQMHDSRYKNLRSMFASDNKPDAPKKIKPQGSMATISGTSEDDMADYLKERRS
jgi:hypothetical protein